MAREAEARSKHRAAVKASEARLLKGLEGTNFMFNYEFMRAEQLASSGQLPNMLQESKLKVPMGVHTYLNVDKATKAIEDPRPHIAAFMLMRQDHWCAPAREGRRATGRSCSRRTCRWCCWR